MTMVDFLRIDPELPDNFFQTPNDDRSRRELDEWWDRPFAMTSPDKATLTVYCLDGGAWDRPTWYGEASDALDAVRLAVQKLKRWREMRSRPIASLEDDGVAIIVDRQRPDGPQLRLGKFQVAEEAAAFLKSLQLENKTHAYPTSA